MAESVMDSIQKAWTDRESTSTETKATETAPAVETQTSADEWDAPSDWEQPERETFRTLPPEVRKTLHGRITGYTSKLGEFEKYQERYKPFDTIFEQRKALMQGLAPHDATERLFANLELAQRDPKGFARQFFKSYNLDPHDVFEIQKAQAAAAEQGAYVDPEIQALRDELSKLKNGFQETQAQIQARQQREQAERDAAWAKQVDEFRNEKGTDGKTPLRPHMKDVEVHMAALLQSRLAKDLQDAYDQAVYANPTVRAKVLAEAKAAERQEADRKEREHAAKAAKAGATVTPSGAKADSATSQPKKGESVRESLRRAHAALSSKDAA